MKTFAELLVVLKQSSKL